MGVCGFVRVRVGLVVVVCGQPSQSRERERGAKPGPTREKQPGHARKWAGLVGSVRPFLCVVTGQRERRWLRFAVAAVVAASLRRWCARVCCCPAFSAPRCAVWPVALSRRDRLCRCCLARILFLAFLSSLFAVPLFALRLSGCFSCFSGPLIGPCSFLLSSGLLLLLLFLFLAALFACSFHRPRACVIGRRRRPISSGPGASTMQARTHPSSPSAPLRLP